LWKVCLGDKIPLKERVDEVMFSLIVRGRNGMLSQRCLTDPKNKKLNLFILFAIKLVKPFTRNKPNLKIIILKFI